MVVDYVPARLLWFVLALSNLMTAQTRIDEYTVGAEYRETTWIVPLERFNEPNLASLGSTTLRPDHHKWRVSVTWVVTNEEDRFDLLGPAATDQSYDQWRSQWVSMCTRRFPVARLLVINGGGELLIRTSENRLQKSTIGSHDPSVVRIRGKAYRIVNIDVAGRDYEPSGRTKFRVDLIELDAAPGKPSSTDVARAMNQLFRSRDFTVRIRGDFWFRESRPVVFPFISPIEPPRDMKTHGSGEVIVCDSSAGKTRCY